MQVAVDLNKLFHYAHSTHKVCCVLVKFPVPNLPLLLDLPPFSVCRFLRKTMTQIVITIRRITITTTPLGTEPARMIIEELALVFVGPSCVYIKIHADIYNE